MSGAHFNGGSDTRGTTPTHGLGIKHEVKINHPQEPNSSNYLDSLGNSYVFGGAKLQKNTQADMISDENGEIDNASVKKDSFD